MSSNTSRRFTKVAGENFSLAGKLLALLVALVASVNWVPAQSPGGVTANLTLWVKGDVGTSCTDCGNVTFWNDQSATMNNGTSGGNNAGQRPDHELGVMNFNPAVFMEDDHYIDFSRSASSLEGNFTILTAFRTVEDDDSLVNCCGLNNDGWYSAPSILSNQYQDGSDFSDYGIAFINGKIIWGHSNAAGTNGNRSVFLQAAQLPMADDIPHAASIRRQTSGTVTLSIQGAARITNAGAEPGQLDAPNNTLRAGRSADNGSGGGYGEFEGYYGEIIGYSDALNPAQENSVMTYLALKYGFPLEQSYAVIGTNLDSPYQLGTHPDGIIGIARWDASALDQRQSVSLIEGSGSPGVDADTAFAVYLGTQTPYFPDGKSLNNPNAFAADGLSLVVGHDGQPGTFSAAWCGVPGRQLGRTYKVTNIGVSDPVTLAFYPEDITDFKPNGNYSLVISADQTFDGSDEIIQLTEFDDNVDVNLWYASYTFPMGGAGLAQNTFFTIIEGPAIAPGGVGDGLQFWVKADNGMDFNVNFVWEDLSGFGRDLTSLAGAINANRIVGGVNYNDYLNNDPNSFAVNCSTAQQFQGVSIIGVFKGGLGDNEDEVMGMNADNRGLLIDVQERVRKNAPTSWTDGGNGATLYQNGEQVAPSNYPITENWGIYTGRRPADPVEGQFFIGSFSDPAKVADSYDFAEAMVYAFDIAGGVPSAQDQIESYLGIKYGLTLDHNYYASDGTPLYDVATYENDIAGIGIDTCTGLHQRQSMSLSADAIVEIGHVSIEPSNATNPNDIPGDRKYLIWGHDGNTSDCWSNNEVSADNFPAFSRLWIRIGREWRFTESAAPGIGNILLRMDTTAIPGGFNFPNLPADAVGLYIFIDNDDDFSAGANAYLMTYNTAVNKFEVTIPAIDRPTGTGYFTFGALIDDATVTNQSFCDGETLTLIGSHLYSSGFCSQVDLNGPGGPYTIFGTAPAPFNWSFDGNDFLNDNCLDTVTWVIPPLGTGPGEIQSGLHPLQMQLNNGPCTGVTPTDYIRYESITIGAAAPSRIYWAANDSTGSDTLNTCVGDTNEPIFILQGDPGEFVLDTTASPLANINQLMTIDTAQDIYVVNVSSGTAGSHAVLFTSLAAGCDTYDTLWINIDTLQESFVSYGTLTPGNPAFREICQGFGNGNYNFDSVAPPGGTFSSLSSNLLLNGAGLINLTNSDTGIHALSYIPPDSLCFSPDTLLIRVVPEDSAIFQYDQMAYCLNDTNPIPLVTYLPSTVDSGFIPVGPGNTLISVDPVTGEIDLVNSLAGSYRIVYHLGVTCAAYDTIDVTLYNVPSPNFSFPNNQDTVCS
ncbi:MAG: hypothetical protein AAF998_19125, partial [Bacteroidota bacterium]